MSEQEAHKPSLGIVGGGQLGRMLTEAALPLGIDVGVVDPGENCPAHQAGAKEITANLYDEAALRQLAKESDFMTVEIEHLDTHVLEVLENEGAVINPRPTTIRLIQDKYAQKVFLKEHGIPVAPFVDLTSEEVALRSLEDFGGSMIIKAKHGAYDGRGNMVVSSPAEVKEAFKTFTDRELYAEQLVPFERELAVMVAKDMRGNVVSYPTVQTIHARNICEEVLAPAPVDESIQEKAGELARQVIELLEGAGLFGVEMFLTEDGKVLVNEIAPRVHNSGHHTMEFSRTSQFEQHVRAVMGLPLGSVESVVPAAVMINILGERDGPTRVTGLDAVLAIPDTSVHIYGKSPTKVDRKMGHITSTGKTVREAQIRARKARKALDI